MRAGNIIGGGDFEYSRLIPEIFLAFQKNNKIFLRNPNAIRPWQHIFDVINALLAIIFKSSRKIENKSITFNVGPNKNSNIKVISLVNKLIKNFDNLKFGFQYKVKFNETKILKLSNKKIKEKIKWKPNISISKALKLTAIWYKEFNNNQNKIYEFSLDQIKNYFKL